MMLPMLFNKDRTKSFVRDKHTQSHTEHTDIVIHRNIQIDKTASGRHNFRLLQQTEDR